MKTRLYVVTVVVAGNVVKHLVDAGQKGSAERHVAAKYIKAEIADGKTVARLMDDGVKMESAAEQPTTGTQGTLPVEPQPAS